MLISDMCIYIYIYVRKNTGKLIFKKHLHEDMV